MLCTCGIDIGLATELSGLNVDVEDTSDAGLGTDASNVGAVNVGHKSAKTMSGVAVVTTTWPSEGIERETTMPADFAAASMTSGAVEGPGETKLSPSEL